MENSLGVRESQGESVSREDLYDWCQEVHAPWSQNAETSCKGQPYKRVKPRPHHQAVTRQCFATMGLKHILVSTNSLATSHLYLLLFTLLKAKKNREIILNLTLIIKET